MFSLDDLLSETSKNPIYKEVLLLTRFRGPSATCCLKDVGINDDKVRNVWVGLSKYIEVNIKLKKVKYCNILGNRYSKFW